MPSTITDRLNGLSTSVAVKAPARVATTAAITLSGEQTIDGVAVVSGDRVLVKDQSSAIDNGIWVASSGVWSRTADFDGTFDVVGGTQLYVISGTVNGSSYWRVSGSGSKQPGTDSISFVTISGTTTLASDLASTSGSSLVAFLQSGTGAVARTVQSKLRDTVSIFDFMTTAQIADYQGRTASLDHTSAFNTARTAVSAAGGARKLVLPAGILNLTSTITHAGSFEMEGAGHSGQDTTADATDNQGTLIKLNHTGVGFDVSDGGLTVRDLGWYRPQTAPGGGWTPYASDWDFQLATTDSYFENVLAWGSRKGIVLNAGGRLRVKGLLGQFFLAGIKVVLASDKCVFDDIHLWPVWSQNANVKSNMLANYIAMELQDCDNPMVSNYFSIWARKSISLSQGAAGSTRKLNGVNIDMDEGSAGICVESGTTGVTAQLTNVSHQSDSTASNGCSVELDGASAIISIDGLNSTASNISAIRNEDGTDNRLTVSRLYMTGWNQANGSHTGASLAGSGNELCIIGKAVIGTASAGSTNAFGGAGQKQGLWARGTKSGTTAADGRISAAHALGYAPGTADAKIVGALPYVVNVESVDATNINLFVTDGAGVALASTAVNLNWWAYY